MRLTGDGRDGRHTGRNRQVSLPQYEAIAARQQAFSSMLAFGDTRFNLSPPGEVRYVEGCGCRARSSRRWASRRILGRLIGPADDRPGCGAPVAVISYALWQREFGGRPDVIGQTVSDGRTRVPIIGVTPPSVLRRRSRAASSAWRCRSAASRQTRRDHWWLAAIGRLKPGWTRAQAQAHLQGLLPAIQRDTLPDYRADLAVEYLGMGAEVVDASAGVSPLRRSYQQPLWVLMAIAALVLLIAAVNLANLLLARATARGQEFSLRLALGGSRGRILQQVFTESVLLALFGSLAAVGVAMFVSRSIPPLISTAVDRIHLDLSIDWRVLGFTALAATTTALIFGMAPAVKAARSPVVGAAGRGAAANTGLTLRRGLVAVQIAVTLVLLFGGLLFLRSLRNLSAQDTGVNQRGIVVANLFFNEKTYPMERRAPAYRAIDERLRALTGVVSLAEAFTTPLGGSIWDTDVEFERKVKGTSNVNQVSPGYFATLGTRLVAGRDFDERDGPGAPRVAIVSESFAAKFLDGEAIGKRFSKPSDTGPGGTEYEIVGMVADQKYGDIRAAATRIFFIPSSQDTAPRPTRRYAIRSTESPSQTIAAVGAAVAAIDPRDQHSLCASRHPGRRCDAAGPSDGASVGDLRHGRAGAGRGGPLRRRVVYRGQPPRRDRRAGRAWRQRCAHSRHDPRRRGPHARRRRGRRRGRGARGRQGRDVAPLRPRARRRLDPGVGDWRADAGGTGRGRVAGPSGRPHRSRDGAPRRLTGGRL